MKFTNVCVKGHLLSRHLDLRLHKVWIDEQEKVATFPIYELNGEMVGYHQYRPSANKEAKNNPREGRYFTKKSKGIFGLWGMESWRFSKTLFVTEGVFDACRLTAKGFSAVATLSNDLNETTKNWFYTIRAVRPVIVVCDSGEAGKKLRKAGHSYVTMPDGEDMGSVDQDFVNNFLKNFN